MGQLVAGIGERLAQLAFGHDASSVAEMFDEFEQMVEEPAGFEPADFLSFERPGALFSQPSFDPVDPADDKKYPGGDARVVAAGLGELPADMGETGHRRDGKLRMALDEGSVGAQTVALEVAVEGAFAVPSDENGVQACVGAAFVPVEKHAVLGVVVDPELAGRGFTLAGSEASDGRLMLASARTPPGLPMAVHLAPLGSSTLR